MAAEGEIEYKKTKPSRKSAKDDFFSSKKLE